MSQTMQETYKTIVNGIFTNATKVPKDNQYLKGYYSGLLNGMLITTEDSVITDYTQDKLGKLGY